MNKIALTIAFAIILIVAVITGLGFFNENQEKNQTAQDNFATQTMQIETLKEGSGEGAKTEDKVTVNYTGTLENGTKFDSSVDPAFGHVEPFEFTLGEGRVIQGWEQGVFGMKIGEKRKLTIPPDLGYGEAGAGAIIPPNSTLIFEIDLLKIN